MPLQTSLVDIWSSRPDLQAAFPKGIQGGTRDNLNLNAWWNNNGVNEYPHVTLVPPGSPQIQPPATLTREAQARQSPVASAYQPAGQAPGTPAVQSTVQPAANANVAPSGGNTFQGASGVNPWEVGPATDALKQQGMPVTQENINNFVFTARRTGSFPSPQQASQPTVNTPQNPIQYGGLGTAASPLTLPPYISPTQPPTFSNLPRDAQGNIDTSKMQAGHRDAQGNFVPDKPGVAEPIPNPTFHRDTQGNFVPDNPGVFENASSGVNPWEVGSAADALKTTGYGDLVNVNNTIYNTQTGQGYATPQALAADLGISPTQLNNQFWLGIPKQDTPPEPPLPYGGSDTNPFLPQPTVNTPENPIQYGGTGTANDPVTLPPYISATQPKSEYTATPDGKAAATGATTTPDGVLPTSLSNLGLYNAPPEVFNPVIPQLVPGTPEYQAAIDKISTAYYDIMQQQMNATTDQEKNVAENNWGNLKNYIEKNLNVKLSGDALQAWDQVQGLNSQGAAKNIQGSGIETESLDQYLRRVRTTDQYSRVDAKTQTEKAQQDYYTTYATPAQIKEFAAANPSLAKSWGLTPSDEIKNAMSPAALKAKYPNASDADIAKYSSAILDKDGNYRSKLYDRYMTGGKPGISPGTPNIEYDQYGTPIKEIVTPATTGLLDIDAAKKQYLEDTIKNQNLQVDAAARRASGLTRPSTPAETAANPSGSTEFNKVPTTPPGSTPSTSTQPPNTGAKPTIANPLPGFSGSTPAVNPVTAQMIARGMPAPGTPAFNQQGARPSGPLPGQQGGPSSSPTASSSAQPGPKKTYSSLYDYYSANGGWNTLDSKRRKADAKAAGIDGYTGTAAQNRVLLSHLQGQGTSPITPSMTLPGINMSNPAANMSTPSGNKYVPPPSLGGSNPYRPIPAATMSPPEKPLDGGNAQSPYGPLPAASRMATLPEEKPWAPGGGLNATGASGGNPKQIMVGGQIINL